jgi:hypothetical protein
VFGNTPTAGPSSSTVGRPGGIDLRPFLAPSSSSRPTVEGLTPVLPSRQIPQSEEGRTQAQEQPPETQRTVVQQEPGSPPSVNPTGVEPEHFELSPEKTGLINVGSLEDPIYVYKK